MLKLINPLIAILRVFVCLITNMSYFFVFTNTCRIKPFHVLQLAFLIYSPSQLDIHVIIFRNVENSSPRSFVAKRSQLPTRFLQVFSLTNLKKNKKLCYTLVILFSRSKIVAQKTKKLLKKQILIPKTFPVTHRNPKKFKASIIRYKRTTLDGSDKVTVIPSNNSVS